MVRFTENDRKIGSCVHLVNDFVCSHGKYQNYPCPYRSNAEKCPCYVAFTEQMEKQLNEKGYFSY
jgi:hypothetical protein